MTDDYLADVFQVADTAGGSDIRLGAAWPGAARPGNPAAYRPSLTSFLITVD